MMRPELSKMEERSSEKEKKEKKKNEMTRVIKGKEKKEK